MAAVELKKSAYPLIAVITITFLVMLIVVIPKFDTPSFGPNIYQCGEQFVPFRANISDCMAVETTDDQVLAGTLTSPLANNVFILVDPAADAEVGLAANEIYKISDAIWPVTGLKTGIVYTELWNKTPEVAVLSIENASFENPIIWLRTGQSRTYIDQNGPQVTVYSDSQKGLDAATCKIAILMMEEVLEC